MSCDFGSDFDFDFGYDIDELIPKEELREMYETMKARFAKGDYLANPLVWKTISEMKSLFESDCLELSVDPPDMQVHFNDMFNSVGLWVECDCFQVGNEIKIKFDSLIERCSNFEVYALNNGHIRLTFGFNNAFIFTNIPD